MSKFLAESVLNFILFILPILICFPILPFLKKRGNALRFGLAILLPCIIANLYNDFSYYGFRLRLADERGNNHDGVAMNVFFLFLSFMIPLIVAFPCGLILGIKEWREERKNAWIWTNTRISII